MSRAGRGRRRGLTLVEVVVAMAVLAAGGVALQRLVARSVMAIAADREATRAMALGRALLAEAALDPPEPGREAGSRGLRFEREVRRTPHPDLREVRIRVFWGARDARALELVELVRVPRA